MLISVNSDYAGFKAVCAELGGASGPAHLFYTTNSGVVNSVLAIFTGGFYVTVGPSTLTTTTLTADFPRAILTATDGSNIGGAY